MQGVSQKVVLLVEFGRFVRLVAQPAIAAGLAPSSNG